MISGQATTFHKAEWFKSDDESHGFDGPLHIEPRPLAPISNLLLVSMQSKGFKLQDDMFTTGNNPHGCGHAPRSTYSGLRTTAADYLKPDRPNLKVITEDIVDRIILTNENGQRSASAVKILDKENTSIEVDVKREIIVSAGTYCSPAILMVPGWDPRRSWSNWASNVLSIFLVLGRTSWTTL